MFQDLHCRVDFSELLFPDTEKQDNNIRLVSSVLKKKKQLGQMKTQNTDIYLEANLEQYSQDKF